MRSERKTINVFSAMDKGNLARLVGASRSISHVFEQLQLRKSGAAFKIFRKVIEEQGIDISHFVTAGDLSGYRQKKTIEETFVNDLHVSGSTLRNKIIKHNLHPYSCSKCNNKGEWMGEPIVLQIDHINGVRTDNRLENLRFLCPNCHSQTPTFCGRKTATKPRCPTCNLTYRGAGRRCRKCSAKLVKRACAIMWPKNEELTQIVWEKPLSLYATELRCSLTALRKHCKRQNISYPPLGYWERRRQGYTHEESLVSQKQIRSKAKRISDKDIAKAQLLIKNGCSLRAAARQIGCSHQTILRRLSKTN